MSDLTSRIRSRGHWIVAIHPAEFEAERIPYDQLDEIVPAIAVRLRGWPVPFANEGRRELIRKDDWVGMEVDADMVSMYEAWRLYRSGLFTHLRAVSADWRSGAEATRLEEGYASVIEVWEILFYLTEVFELAARLALSPAGDNSMVISAELHNLDGRGLVVGQPNRVPFLEPYKTHSTAIEQKAMLSREQLVGDNRKEAVKMAREFFLRFGWKPSIENLVDHQRDLTEN